MDAEMCIVGGGPAGMALARALLRHGVTFDCFERHSDVGGLWDRTNPGTPVYDSAHFISSKTMSHYVGDPMPEWYPDYPSYRQIHDYLRSFADEYGLRDRMTFSTEVTAAVPVHGGWRVTLRRQDGSTEERTYAALAAASGTNWHPVLPDYPGEFTGEIRHSQTYGSSDELRGKRVLVIGAGNSGVDIACDAARSADRAFLSVRRGYHFIPKHVFGVPADVFAANGPQLPMWLEQRVFGALLRLLNGDMTRLGLPKPDHRVFETHPIMNTQVLHHLGHGDLIAKPDVERFDGDQVVFVDGTREPIDLVLCATGYAWRIPYVPASEVDWSSSPSGASDQRRPSMYLTAIGRTNPRLYGMGYVETNGGAYKLFDEVADLIARAYMARREGTAEGLEELIRTDRVDLRGGVKHVPTQRHASYVESGTFVRHLARVRKRLGWPSPTPRDFDHLRTRPGPRA
jgi:hypothetical protein